MIDSIEFWKWRWKRWKMHACWEWYETWRYGWVEEVKAVAVVKFKAKI